MINYNKFKIIQEVQKNGISECKEFFDKDKFEALEKMLTYNKYVKGTKNSFFYRSKRKFLLKKLFNFELTKFFDCLRKNTREERKHIFKDDAFLKAKNNNTR